MSELGVALALPEVPAAADEIRRVVTVFRELRSGVTADELAVNCHHNYVEKEHHFGADVYVTRKGAMRAGETVLVHAGASGVGTAAIQIGRELGTRIVVTAGSDKKLARCRELGAVLAIDYQRDDFAAAVMTFTDNQGVDLILDCVGGPYLEKNIAILKPYGRLITIGVMGGTKASLDMAAVLMKSLTVKGTRLRARSREEKVHLTQEFRDRIWPLMVAGKIAPVVDRVFPITSAGAAHQYVKENRNIGKVVLEVRPALQ